MGVSDVESTGGYLGHARRELAKVIVGQREPLDLLLLTVVSGGHALVEGVPGIAKTLAVRAMARILSLAFSRVQCTPDLMPGDIVGANVFRADSGQFVLHKGPVFTDLLLVDEINRMPPRDAGGAAGGDGGAPGYDRRPQLSAGRDVHDVRDAESRRVRRYVSAPRSANSIGSS